MLARCVSFSLTIPCRGNIRSLCAAVNNNATKISSSDGSSKLIKNNEPRLLYNWPWNHNILGAIGLRKASSAADTPPPPVPMATYEEVKNLPNHPEKLLVDVREPGELAETGRIPTSINVPLGDVELALSDATSASAFRKRYGHDKPSENNEVIFMCKIGKRSETAANIAINLGFKNVKNYRGSWLEWAEREGLDPTYSL